MAMYELSGSCPTPTSIDKLKAPLCVPKAIERTEETTGKWQKKDKAKPPPHPTSHPSSAEAMKEAERVLLILRTQLLGPSPVSLWASYQLPTSVRGRLAASLVGEEGPDPEPFLTSPPSPAAHSVCAFRWGGQFLNRCAPVWVRCGHRERLAVGRFRLLIGEA